MQPVGVTAAPAAGWFGLQRQENTLWTLPHPVIQRTPQFTLTKAFLQAAAFYCVICCDSRGINSRTLPCKELTAAPARLPLSCLPALLSLCKETLPALLHWLQLMEISIHLSRLSINSPIWRWCVLSAPTLYNSAGTSLCSEM